MKKLIILSSVLVAAACASDDPCLEDGSCVDELDVGLTTVITSSLANGPIADFAFISNDIYYSQQEAASCLVTADRARIAKVSKNGGAPTDIYLAAGCGGSEIQPQDILAVGSDLFVVDVRNGKVLKMSSAGTVAATHTGFTFSATPHRQRLAYDSGNATLYIGDDNKVWKSTSSGTATPVQFVVPGNPVKNLAFDGTSLFVNHADKIDKVSTAGSVTAGWVDVPTSIDAMALVGTTELVYLESNNFEVHKVVISTGVDTTIYDSAANVRKGTSALFDSASGKLLDIDFDISGSNDHDLMRHLSSSSWARTEQLSSQDMEGAGNLMLNSGKVYWFSNGSTSRGIFSESLTSL